MDITSLLPLLMQQKGGGGNDRYTAMINAMNAMKGGDAKTAESVHNPPSANPMSAVLESMSGGGKPDPAMLLQAMAKNNGGKDSAALNLVSALSMLNQQNRKTKTPYGLKPVKAFVPDEILGKLVKYFNA